MAGQPTPPGPRTPPRNSIRPYESRAYENPLVSLNKAENSTLISRGGKQVCGLSWSEELQLLASGGNEGNVPWDKTWGSGQFITTSAEVTPNGGLVRESPPKWP